MIEMLQMDKYAAYVWSAYGIAFVVMAYTAIKPLKDRKALMKELMMKYRRETRQADKKEQM
jgi:heme exporter protein CcmD